MGKGGGGGLQHDGALVLLVDHIVPAVVDVVLAQITPRVTHGLGVQDLRKGARIAIFVEMLNKSGCCPR